MDAYLIIALSPSVIWGFHAYPQGPQFLIQTIKNPFRAPLSTAAARTEMSVFTMKHQLLSQTWQLEREACLSSYASRLQFIVVY